MTNDQTPAITYDIIGDVHGHHDKLIALLQKLGYQKQNGAWAQIGYRAVFVGDLIDKGPKPAAVLKTVKAMIEAGAAMMVVGNHELNWIQAAADHTGDIIAFMDATERHYSRCQLTKTFKYEPKQLIETFQWLRNQPIYIEQDDLRVVHACWDEEALTTLKVAGIDCLDDKALAGYRDTYSDIYLAIDRVVAGCAHQFPPSQNHNTTFRSTRRRIQWWPEDRVAINPIELPIYACKTKGPDAEKAPVFFGHYAMVGTPDTVGPNIAGVDYSAAYGGKLTAYRHKAGQPLDREHFVT
ncbi:metallophosphoesterase [Marinobacter sp. SS5-14b]|uniref:metallophosphoesterase n=1 Tax=Marinobacter sp. SS5-14b TaxID=3050456 RepID=UPI0026DEDD61|nr:metallophosphoesterase [Marinobacter sp. SS5-14b]